MRARKSKNGDVVLSEKNSVGGYVCDWCGRFSKDLSDLNSMTAGPQYHESDRIMFELCDECEEAFDQIIAAISQQGDVSEVMRAIIGGDSDK